MIDVSIKFENTGNAKVMTLSGANTSSQMVTIVPGSTVKEGVITRPGGVKDYGVTVQVKPAKAQQ